MDAGNRLVITRSEFDALFAALHAQGYSVWGPHAQDGAIVYEPLHAAQDLPVGLGDEQAGGRYRLRERGDGALFGYAVGPHSWKRLLHPPLETLWRAERNERGFRIEDPAPAERPLALVGVRPCELAALDTLDGVLLGGARGAAAEDGADQPAGAPASVPAVCDTRYAARRRATLLVVVDCTAPAGTCFCASLGTGPAAGPGGDLRLTELDAGTPQHRFLVEARSPRGVTLAAALPQRAAEPADERTAQAARDAAAAGMERKLETQGLKELLYRQYEHPRWEELGRRCLGCTNCTQVCPTCFCSSVEDVSSLDGRTTERRRRSDSCFSLEFSYVHGGSVRTTPGARYRQWLTHKLGTWHDQFGRSGCVGCGRCITWCPVGIDLTVEARALRAEDEARR
jgi:ferredoxin